MYPCYLRLD